ncbi:MAG: HAMP domain-containing histidine kinase [Chloroflexota bacterium]|nr:MAG: HAMP domain-containing histidine kinase [Chloroflexota bacterium]
MRRTVGWHFFIYSLAIILVAIVAVGAVTLLLVNANFSRQEEQYLFERGDHLVEPLQSVFQWGADPAELQDIASFGLFTGHVRIRITDPQGHVLADSGSFSELLDIHAEGPVESSATAFQLLFDQSGRYQAFRMPAFRPESFGPLMMPGRPRSESGSQIITAEPAPQPPIVDISDAAVSLPLRVDSEVVGYAELSEGPAFGQAIRETLQQALLFGGLVALLVAAVAAVMAARQVTRPLQSLGQTADEMARGNLDARADGSKLAEIDRLASQFNSMADQLTTTIASLEAERASLRRFIADASHELRTPLTALKTFNALMDVDGGPESGRTAELVRESGRQLNQLDRLTSDLLDLSRLESRINGADLHVADIRVPVSKAIAALRPLSVAKMQMLQEDLPTYPVLVAHEPALLQRAVENLVSNAVKYSPVESLVLVSLLSNGRSAGIHVRDEGPGILQVEQEHIFGRFYRGRQSGDDGSGLGLAIAREIALIHDGEILFTSEQGKGSHFVLRLPLTGHETDPDLLR